MAKNIWTRQAGNPPPDAKTAPPVAEDRCDCLATGTRILTPYGDVPVQNLRPGDEVLVVLRQGDAVRKIKWVGQRTLEPARHARPEKLLPVRILAGAISPGLPEHDLLLSPDHGLYFERNLIEARTLVNGATIIQDKLAGKITYHHIELARHGIMLAEGVPVESFLGPAKTMFEGAGPLILHPDFAAPQRRGAYAPLVAAGPVVAKTRQLLLDRAFALGFAATDATDLHVKAGIEKLRPEPDSTPTRLIFQLGHPYREVQLLSSAGVPAHLRATVDDRRRLGAAITGLTLLAGAQCHEIALDHPAHRGFHPMENGHRWTDGAACIALPPYTGPARLEIRLKGQAPRWTTTRNPAEASA